VTIPCSIVCSDRSADQATRSRGWRSPRRILLVELLQLPVQLGMLALELTGFSKKVSVADREKTRPCWSPRSRQHRPRSWAASRRNRSYSSESTPAPRAQGARGRIGAPSVTPSSGIQLGGENSCNTTFSPSAGLRAHGPCRPTRSQPRRPPHDSPIRRAGGGATWPVAEIGRPRNKPVGIHQNRAKRRIARALEMEQQTSTLPPQSWTLISSVRVSRHIPRSVCPSGKSAPAEQALPLVRAEPRDRGTLRSTIPDTCRDRARSAVSDVAGMRRSTADTPRYPTTRRRRPRRGPRRAPSSPTK